MNLAFLSCDINVTVVSPSCNHTMTINSTIIHTQCSTFTPLEYIFLQVAIHTRYTFKLTRLLHMSPRKETDCCYPITRSTIMHQGIQNVSKSPTCKTVYIQAEPFEWRDCFRLTKVIGSAWGGFTLAPSHYYQIHHSCGSAMQRYFVEQFQSSFNTTI